MKWYKRDPDAALAGMIGLTPEERGIYNTVIDLLYSRDGDIPADDIFCARACGCDPRTWRRVRDILLAKGKFHIKPDGKLTANRVEDELKIARRLIEDMSKLGRSSAEKRKKINGHNPTAPLVTTTTTTREDAADAALIEPEKALFRRGKEVAGKQAGGLIARLLASKKGNVALARSAIETASTKENPREYLAAVTRSKSRNEMNGEMGIDFATTDWRDAIA